jgi:cytochrome c oxidase subunit III
MKERVALDLSKLPLHGMGTASITWWGTLAFMLIEGTGFALVIAVYFYLMSLAATWPVDAPKPDLLPGTLVTLILLASLVPNVLMSRWAEQQDLRKVRIGMVVMSFFGFAPLIVRIFEFPATRISWDSNAYGSIVWTLLGLHTTHMITDLVDTACARRVDVHTPWQQCKAVWRRSGQRDVLELCRRHLASDLRLHLLDPADMSTSRIVSHLLLWAGLWVAPLVWAANMQLGQILPYADCRSQLHGSALASMIAATIAALSGLASWRSARSASADADVSGETVSFAGTLSSLAALVFTFALVMQGIASMVLTGCER